MFKVLIVVVLVSTGNFVPLVAADEFDTMNDCEVALPVVEDAFFTWLSMRGVGPDDVRVSLKCFSKKDLEEGAAGDPV